MKSLALKVVDWVVFSLAFIIVLLAVLLSLARLFLPHMTKYQPRVQEWASHALHQPVHIGEMTAAWRGLEPEFKFKQVEILNPAGTHVLLEVQELGLGIDLFKSLLKWQIVPGWVVVSGANISLHQDANGKVTINGFAPAKQNATSAVLLEEVGDWLLAQNRIYLEHVNATWYGNDGRVIPFKRLRLKLTNTFLSHSLIGEGEVAQLPHPTVFNFVLNLSGDFFATKDFKGKLSLHAKRVQLGLWLNKHIPNLEFSHGIGNVELGASWDNGQLQELQSKFIAEDTGLKSKYLIQDLLINNVVGEFAWQRQDQGWNLAVTNTRLNSDNLLLPKVQFTLNSKPAQNSQPATQTVQTDSLALQDVKNILLLTTLPSEYNRSLLNQINPKGELQNFTLVHTDLSPQALINKKLNPAEFNLQTKFNNVAWSRWQKLPGVSNLTGTLNSTPTNGTLTLNAKQTQWDFGTLFRTLIPIDHLQGNVQWQKNADGWQIQTTNMTASNSLISINGNGSLLLPQNNSSPIINILAGFNLVDATQVIKFLPVGIMPKNVVDWLDQAIVAGKDGSGQVVLTGPIRSFPFMHEEGRFIVDGKLNDLTLNYRADWPPIQHLNTELIFDDNSMTINANSGTILGTQLSNTKAVIPDLNKPILQVTGDVKGDLQDAWQFLQQSPLKNTIGKRLADFVMQGPMALNLQLNIPLKTGATTLHGNLTIPGGDLKLPDWWSLHVENLAGNLQFTENTLSGNLQGKLFERPLDVKISTVTQKGKPPLTQLDLGSGQMTLQEIQQRFDLPKLNNVDGTLNYHALLQFASSDSGMNSLIIDSNLQGINVALPPPLAKTPNEIVPAELQLHFNGSKKMELAFDYGKRLSAALTFLKNVAGNLSLYGGELSFGGKQATMQSQPGLMINGTMPNFSWDDWKPFYTERVPTYPKRPPALLRSVDMKFGEFKAFGLTLANVGLQLQPTPKNWNVGIHNANIDGQFTVPYNFPRGVLTGNFQRLYIQPNLTQNKTAILPKDVPAFNLGCRDFRYGNKSFGAVNLKATPVGNTLYIDELNVSSAGLNLVANGQWSGSNATNQQTSLDGKLTSKDLGIFLRNWNITKNIVGGNGTADFSLQWPGPAHQFAMRNLSGQLSLHFFDGRIINLSQATEAELGLGRVLNLLSLQTLPRRLRFDFSDITDSGFSFDVMKGDFSLRQGNALTDDAYIDGPLAKVAIQGRIGLSAQDYNLKLIVTPYVTSNIPAVVATVAGGPIVGAITWLATKVFSTAVKELVTYTYQVTGSWDNPSVVKVTAANHLHIENENKQVTYAR